MTFIVGICRFDGDPPRHADLRAAIEALSGLAPDGVDCKISGNAAFARGLYVITPETAFDRQPCASSCGSLLMVSDARVDNREEILAAIELDRTMPVSDGELLAHGFDRRGSSILDIVCGDFAFAAWDEPNRQLILARDITGQKPLNFFLCSEFVAFASMPHGLLALDGVPCQIDERQIAEFVADVPRSGDRTYFKQVRRVEPGQIARINRQGVKTSRFWRAPKQMLRLPSDQDYVASFQVHLETAVRSRIRGAEKAIGAHLSGGLDSGAVASTAAICLAPSARLRAYTSAPRSNFESPLPRGRIADESSFAALVCAMHPNMDQTIVRSEGASLFSAIRRDSALFGEPLGLPCNQVWWAAISDAAAADGVKVLLTGEAGNHALTSGSVSTLAEFLADGAFRVLAREAFALHREGLRWRGIAAAALGPWVPHPVWKAIQAIQWGRSTTSEGAALLSKAARDLLPHGLAQIARSGRPLVNQRQTRCSLLQGADPGLFRKGTLARWGIEERDPTTDRRLVEFCLSLPPEQLLRGGITRSLARRSLTDRLPPEVINGPRGYQGADWFERVDTAELFSMIKEVGANTCSAKLFDLTQMGRLANSWPDSGWHLGSTISTFRYGLPRAIAAGMFVTEFISGRLPTLAAATVVT